MGRDLTAKLSHKQIHIRTTSGRNHVRAEVLPPAFSAAGNRRQGKTKGGARGHARAATGRCPGCACEAPRGTPMRTNGLQCAAMRYPRYHACKRPTIHDFAGARSASIRPALQQSSSTLRPCESAPQEQRGPRRHVIANNTPLGAHNNGFCVTKEPKASVSPWGPTSRSGRAAAGATLPGRRMHVATKCRDQHGACPTAQREARGRRGKRGFAASG